MRSEVPLFSKIYSILSEDYKILKLIFIISASCMIFSLFYDFLIVKPTYTSLGKRNISVEDFPVITLCPQQPINMSAVNLNGYYDLDAYFLGLLDGNDSISIISWAGNKSEDVHTVSEELSNLKLIQNCQLPTDNFKNSIFYESDNTYND